MPGLMRDTVQWEMRKTTVVRCRCSLHLPEGCKVKCPSSGNSQWMLCLAPETPLPPHCRNWHEAGGRLSEPDVVLFIWERKWPFWKNAAQRPVSKSLSAFALLLLCHFSPSQGWKWIAGQPGPSSFSSSVDVAPLRLTLRRVGNLCELKLIFLSWFSHPTTERDSLIYQAPQALFFSSSFENPYTVLYCTSHNLHSVL